MAIRPSRRRLARRSSLAVAPRFLRPTVALCAALATCLTGASRLLIGWHRPADVVTAILVTAIWTVVGMGVLRYVRPADFAVPARGGLVLVPLMTIATLFLSFCAVILYLIAIFAPDSRWCVYRGDLHDYCGLVRRR